MDSTTTQGEQRNRSNREIAWFRWALVAAWMAVIFGLSTMHGSSVPGRFATFGHLGVYAVLGALAWGAFSSTTNHARAIGYATLLASLYGVSDEWHQSFVPGRMPDVVDWGVDTIGALVGAAALYAVLRAIAKRRNR